MLCTLVYAPLALSYMHVYGNIYTSQWSLLSPGLSSPFISLPHTVSATAHADSKVTNTLKVPLARGKTVKQNYMLERSFIIMNVVISDPL